MEAWRFGEKSLCIHCSSLRHATGKAHSIPGEKSASSANTNAQLSSVLLSIINMFRQLSPSPPPSQPMSRQQRAEYVDSNMDIVEQCHVCFEPFNAAHLPARFRGASRCQHIFGAPCMREWCLNHNENATRCPICRTEMFTIEDYEDGNAESDRSDSEESRYEELIALLNRHAQDMGLASAHFITDAQFDAIRRGEYLDDFADLLEIEDREYFIRQQGEQIQNSIWQQHQDLENSYMQQDQPIRVFESYSESSDEDTLSGVCLCGHSACGREGANWNGETAGDPSDDDDDMEDDEEPEEPTELA